MATTLATFRTALEETWTGLADTVADLPDDEWLTPTELPGWTVKDNVAHVAGIELLLLGEPYPEHVLPDGLTHISTDAQRFIEVPVDLRRPWSPAEVLAELRDVTARRLKVLGELGEDDMDTEVPGMTGQPVRLRHLLGVRTFDSWAHEQDVRRALGRPGGLGSEAAAIARRRLLLAFGALPVEAGRRVVFETTGALPSVTTVTFGAPYAEGDDAGADARVTLDFETFVRLGMGRAHWPDVPGVAIAGDTAFAEDVLGKLAITP